MSDPDLLNPRAADALMAKHARDGWAKAHELEVALAGTLAKLERMREALERIAEARDRWNADKDKAAFDELGAAIDDGEKAARDKA
jgi:hypothetical protein